MSKQLPKDFLWGFATASYQIEGAAQTDGRADSIWDTFCRIPGKIADGTSGDVACGSYHRYKEDIAILKSLGAKAYRFSISWSRVIPLGGHNDPINTKGLRFYQNVVDELLANGIKPMVTLFHWDLPQALYDRYGGFLDQQQFVRDYVNFSKVMFEALGDRVKHWITFNEPWCSSILGYSTGQFAPGHTSDRKLSKVGNSSTEPWLAGHAMLVAHGAAVKLYRDKYKPTQQGQIGITLNGDWTIPWDKDDPKDIEAAQRRLEFQIGWFADPIYRGEYPSSMRAQLGDRLPKWTADEIALVQGSNDFYGMNHYTADYVRHRDGEAAREDFVGNVTSSKENKEGNTIGPETECAWLRPNAAGFRSLLGWISQRYNHPIIIVTENGTSVKDECSLGVEQAINDTPRVKYYTDYIAALVAAREEDNVDVRGYMAWSLLDNFEWADGYKTRFGVTYVDYANNQQRHVKASAHKVAAIFSELCQGP